MLYGIILLIWSRKCFGLLHNMHAQTVSTRAPLFVGFGGGGGGERVGNKAMLIDGFVILTII